MRKKCSLMALFLCLAVALSACGGEAPVGTVTPTKEPVTVKLVTKPSPPAQGEVELVFKLTDEQGQPITDAEVKVMAEYTGAKGVSMEGVAADQGNGQYALIANFSTPGTWKLILSVYKRNLLNYEKTLKIKIQ